MSLHTVKYHEEAHWVNILSLFAFNLVLEDDQSCEENSDPLLFTGMSTKCQKILFNMKILKIVDFYLSISPFQKWTIPELLISSFKI